MKRRNELKAIIALVALIAFSAGFFAAWFSSQTLANAAASSGETLAELQTRETLTASGRVLAVRSTDRMGVVGSVDVEIRPGKGRVLINTNPFVEPDTQYSAETAVRVAQEYTGKSLGDRDIIFSFSSESQLVGGPSAGAMMTVATIAALEGKALRGDAALTGTIEQDGRIGWVGSVLEKSEAAARDGVKTFLVPKGMEHFTYYLPKTRESVLSNGLVVNEEYYQPYEIDFNDFTTKTYGMQTLPVATISDAVNYFLE